METRGHKELENPHGFVTDRVRGEGRRKYELHTFTGKGGENGKQNIDAVAGLCRRERERR